MLYRLNSLPNTLAAQSRIVLRDFAQLAANELRHYAVATAMRRGCLPRLNHQYVSGPQEDSSVIPCRNQSRLIWARLSASTHAHQDPPNIQIRIFRRNKEHFRGVACGLGFRPAVECPHGCLRRRKSAASLRNDCCWCLTGGTRLGNAFFQVGFVESCFAAPAVPR